MPEKIEVKFICLSESNRENIPSYILLGEENSNVVIPIIIGENEAQALSSALKRIKDFRPSPQDLLASTIENFGISIKEVFIYHYENGIYNAELVMGNGNKTCRIDARPSDAINILQKFEAPIYTTREVIDKAGVIIKKDTEPVTDENELSDMDISDLQEMLETAVNNEEYEKAAQIHAELKQRTKK